MSAAAPSPPRVPTPWTLGVATTVASLQAVVECAVVASRSELTPGLRAALVGCIGLTWLLAWGALRLRAGAALGLFLLEGTTVVAALGAVEATPPARLALGGTALVVIVTLAASLHAFPAPTLPPS